MNVSEYLKLSNEDLTKELRRLNELYREGYPQVSDEIYDYLFDTLKERDPMNQFSSNSKFRKICKNKVLCF
jgi:NAD-dependent DNA ligase